MMFKLRVVLRVVSYHRSVRYRLSTCNTAAPLTNAVLKRLLKIDLVLDLPIAQPRKSDTVTFEEGNGG